MMFRDKGINMTEDKARWNEKHQSKPMPHDVAPILVKYLKESNVGDALDLACGTGRNTHYLADKGFLVDAIDYSDYALSQIKNLSTITKHEIDIDSYYIAPNRYDLIVNINYLDRRLFPQMKDGLKQGGIIIFETFIVAHGEVYHQPTNIDYVLRKNELLHAFIGLDIIYYEEREELNLRGERVKVASLVARKS